MADQPLVSIGLPIFNCQETVAAAICSIIQQRYPNWELWLIDDGSTDQTTRVAGRFQDERVRLIGDGARLGLAARLNQAIALSQGKYFARMDGDDIAYPERLERQVEFLEANPQLDLVGADVMVFGENGQVLGKRSGPRSHAEICRRPISSFRMFHPTYLGKLAWFRRYEYDARVVVGQDQDLLLRAYRQSHFANLPEILLGYREAKLSLRKILRTRRFFVQAVIRQLGREGRLGLAPLAVVEQVLKGLLDTVAIGTGLNYRLLPQRAHHSISEAEIRRWQQVWRSVNQDQHYG
jgi:glycosyltransferase involved in cell wall biosynthesis